MPAFPKPVLLIGRENMNRATNGDIVVVEVFPESEWKAPADEVVDQDCKYLAMSFGLSLTRVNGSNVEVR